jgi:hypothetical protein
MGLSHELHHSQLIELLSFMEDLLSQVELFLRENREMVPPAVEMFC